MVAVGSRGSECIERDTHQILRQSYLRICLSAYHLKAASRNEHRPLLLPLICRSCVFVCVCVCFFGGGVIPLLIMIVFLLFVVLNVR